MRGSLAQFFVATALIRSSMNSPMKEILPIVSEPNVPEQVAFGMPPAALPVARHPPGIPERAPKIAHKQVHFVTSLIK